MKKLLKVLTGLAFALSVFLMVNASSFAATPASGKFTNYPDSPGGWSLSADGTLTLTPTETGYISYGNWKKNEVKKVVIASGATYIGYGNNGGLFYEHTRLESVSMPNSVTGMDSGTFNGCTNLKEVTLSNNLTEIWSSTFENCKSLKSITIPASVTRIYSWAFARCTSLETISLPEGLSKIDSYCFYGCTNLTGVSIPSSVESIDTNAFGDCNALASVALPSGLNSIGESAFANCYALKEINIPTAVEQIGNYAFQMGDESKSKLEKITFNKTICDVSSMNNYVLSGIPSSAKLIFTNDKHSFDTGYVEKSATTTDPGKYVFECDNCGASYFFDFVKTNNGLMIVSMGSTTKVDEITIPSSIEGTNVTAIGPDDYNSSYSVYSRSLNCNKVIIPNTVKKIGYDAFYHVSAEEIVIPDSVESIGNSAFNNSGITKIAIPTSVKTIGDYAFSNCNNLTEITLPEGLKKIPWSCFSDCKKLSSITFPASLESIEGSAFSGCASLNEIIIPRNVEVWSAIASDNYTVVKVYPGSKTEKNFKQNNVKINYVYELNNNIKVSNFTATRNDCATVTLSWDAVTNASAYEISRRIVHQPYSDGTQPEDDVTFVGTVSGDKTSYKDVYKRTLSANYWSPDDAVYYEILPIVADKEMGASVMVDNPAATSEHHSFDNGTITQQVSNNNQGILQYKCATCESTFELNFWKDTYAGGVYLSYSNIPKDLGITRFVIPEKFGDLPVVNAYGSGFDTLKEVIVPRDVNVYSTSFNEDVTIKVYIGSKAEYSLSEAGVPFEYVYTVDNNAKVENLSAKGYDYESIELSWDSYPGAIGYEIYRTGDEDEYNYYMLSALKFKYLTTVDAAEGKITYVDKSIDANSETLFYYYVLPVLPNDVIGAKNYEVAAKVIDTMSIYESDDVSYPVVKKVVNTTKTKVINTPDVMNASVTVSDDKGIKSVQLNYVYKFFSDKESTSNIYGDYWSFYTYYKEVDLGAGEYTVDLIAPFKEEIPKKKAYGVCVLSSIDVTDTAGNRTTYQTHLTVSNNDVYADDPFAVKIEKEFNITFTGSISNSNAATQVKNMKEGTTVVLLLDEKSEGILKASFLDAIKGKDKTLVVYASEDRDMQWVFYGKDITGETKDLDLRVSVTAVSGKDYGVSGKLLRFDFGENGILPGKVNFRAKSEYIGTMYDAYDDMHLYYINGKDLETVDADCKVIQESSSAWCYFNLTHNSSYFLSGKALKAKATESTVTTGKANKITVKDSIAKTVSTKAQTVKLSAKATAGTITYKSSDTKVKVSTKGVVTIPKNYVGKVKITLTANKKGYKTAVKVVTIEVKPAKVQLKAVKSAKAKQLAVSWAKNTKATGYEIQYSTDKNFKKSVKTVTITKASTASKTITKLTGGKKMYVRIRTYKTVNKVKIYSDWSKVLNVTIKK